MRLFAVSFTVFAFVAAACAQQPLPHRSSSARDYVGFDSNNYPADSALPVLRQHFSFVGYWLNTPPGADLNLWAGKRDALVRQGFGFLVLFNGRLDAQIRKEQKRGTRPAELGRSDAAAAVAAAKREHFPAHTIIFLDQEEGGRLLDEQAAYLFAWTEGVARSDYLPGVYASGQPVKEEHGHTITTAQDIDEHVAAQHLHKIALWVAQDACPPSNGCTLEPPPLSHSGTPDAVAWQYSQSPRRKSITRACGETYAADGNCYAPGLSSFQLDMNEASSSDPSHGR